MLRSHGRTELIHVLCRKEAAEADGEANGGSALPRACTLMLS